MILSLDPKYIKKQAGAELSQAQDGQPAFFFGFR